MSVTSSLLGLGIVIRILSFFYLYFGSASEHYLLLLLLIHSLREILQSKG